MCDVRLVSAHSLPDDGKLYICLTCDKCNYEWAIQVGGRVCCPRCEGVCDETENSVLEPYPSYPRSPGSE
jgi:hypothetical protein